MDMFYRIYIPYSKEFVLTTIKQTTQPLNIANQAYRKMFLSSYNEESEELYISYAGGSMNGGWEMLKVKVKSINNTVVLEGELEVVKKVREITDMELVEAKQDVDSI